MHRIRSRNTKHSKFLWWTKYFRNVLNFWQCYPFRGCKWGSGRKRKQIMPHMLGGWKKKQTAISSPLKICNSGLEPQSRSEPKEEVKAHPKSRPSLELMLQTHSAGSSWHIQARQDLAWLLPAGVQIQRWTQTMRVIMMQQTTSRFSKA